MTDSRKAWYFKGVSTFEGYVLADTREEAIQKAQGMKAIATDLEIQEVEKPGSKKPPAPRKAPEHKKDPFDKIHGML